MAEHPFVSVLMTAYNREDYIGEAIESVLLSTYPRFELIIVDDCSTDNTVAIGRRYAESDSRIKIFQNERNLGDYPNRNKAALYASGKYIKYLDSDDVMYPHCLAVMVDAMEKYPEAAVGISQNRAEDIRPYPILMSPGDAYQEQYFHNNILLYGPTGSIFNRKIFIENKGFSEVRHDGDSITILRLVAMHPMVKIHPGLIWWRRHELQENRFRPKRNMHFKVLKDALNSDYCPLSREEKKAAFQHIEKIEFRIRVRTIMNIVKQIFRRRTISGDL
ncbi:MAG: glycosyltransferase family 2 protein [Bacteroidales bacterium]